MYPSVRLPPSVGEHTTPPRGGPRDRVDGNVVALGFTSMFTDISSEMVNAVLPLYLIFQVGLTPLQFGLFDGFYGAAVVVTAFFGAVLADRLGKYKEIAGAGYGLSALCKIGLVLVRGSGAPIVGLLFLDRCGKGIRTAPRDALISLSSDPDRLGESFGVHRALDTVGALVGPLIAFAILLAAPGDYQVVFLASFCTAVVGVSVLALYVGNRAAAPRAAERRSLGAVARTLWADPTYRVLAAAGFALGMFTVSDSLLFLSVQQRTSLSDHTFTLLPVGTALVYLLLAVPVGRWADAHGRRAVYLSGFVVLGGCYVAVLLSGSVLPALLVVAPLGLYYACTDGVLAAIGSATLSRTVRAAGLAVLGGSIALGRMVSSVTFGFVWGRYGVTEALVVSLAGLVVAVVVAARLLSVSAARTRTGRS
jgi:MFS family permease